ncbi:hypothetical protein B0H17DRAFT_958711, partial [Mycena rosella]
PRADSRSLDSAQSRALIAKGVEVVKANLFDVEISQDCHPRVRPVYCHPLLGPRDLPADPKGKEEIAQGKNLVDAAKEVGVKFFIWSSLPNATKTSNGLYTQVYHVDNKEIIEEYLKASGVPYAVLLTC